MIFRYGIKFVDNIYYPVYNYKGNWIRCASDWWWSYGHQDKEELLSRMKKSFAFIGLADFTIEIL